MKQIYSACLINVPRKTLFFSLVFFGILSVSNAQVYYGTLLGSNEFPANSSPGTGKFIVTINAAANTMRVQVTYSGLVPLTAAGAPSGTTASHIHASAAHPPLSLVNNTGVATTTPTFTGFPQGVGVLSGTYDQTFNMTLTTSFNAAYITANGGTPAAAFTALRTQIAEGRAYLNVHSTAFGGGEIRGYLLPCPTINVSIPDAWALPSGTLANTVYPAYAPASSLTLLANVSGGTGPYTYNWSNNSTTSSITVSPTAMTSYTVNVKDNNGCPGSATKIVNVVDVTGGNKGQQILVCHKGRSTLAIGADGVADHLGHNDMLGNCGGETRSDMGRQGIGEQLAQDALIKVRANPSPNYFELQVSGKAESNLQLKVYDLQGRVVEVIASVRANQMLKLGTSYRPGVYMVQVIQGKQSQTIRLVKGN